MYLYIYINIWMGLSSWTGKPYWPTGINLWHWYGHSCWTPAGILVLGLWLYVCQHAGHSAVPAGTDGCWNAHFSTAWDAKIRRVQGMKRTISSQSVHEKHGHDNMSTSCSVDHVVLPTREFATLVFQMRANFRTFCHRHSPSGGQMWQWKFPYEWSFSSLGKVPSGKLT